MQNIFLAVALLGASAQGFALPQETPGTACSTGAVPSGTAAPGNTCGSTTFTNYTVRSNDTLTTIAQQWMSGICDIAKANGISNPDLITPGQVLTIPTNCVTPDNDSCINRNPPAVGTCVLGVGASYIVKSGDSLSAIATAFNVTLPALEAANPQVTNPDLIVPGQLLNTPICPNSECDSVGTYTIQSGDIFFNLAQQNGVTAGQIESLNPNANVTNLQPGDVIVLPKQCHNATASA